MSSRRRVVTVAGASLGPLGTSGCALWLRADMGVTKNGSNLVSAWADQSGNAHSADQATAANKPLWTASVANGNPGLYFDTPGGNKYLVSDAFSRTGSETLFVVGSVDTIGATHHTFCDGIALNTRRLYENNPAINAYAGASVVGGNLSSSTNYVMRAVFDATGSAALNGTATAGNTGTAAASGITVGAAGGAASPLTGYICEVILYSRELDAAEIARIESYLGGRYGITVA